MRPISLLAACWLAAFALLAFAPWGRRAAAGEAGDFVFLGTVSNPAAAGLPDWTAGYEVRLEAGQVWAVAKAGRSWVYVRPERWKAASVAAGKIDDVGALNFGLLPGAVKSGQIPGTIATNDPGFNARGAMGGAQAQAPDPDPAPIEGRRHPAADWQGYLLPLSIVGAAALLVFARRRN